MILPDGGLAVSVASTVWVGVIVVCVLNLRLGWSLAGLVVPGFLAPILILRPFVGIINIIEGISAYLIVKYITVAGRSLQRWDTLFGRDRFFALILSSVLVRLIADGYLLPVLSNYLQNHYNYQIDYYLDLNSFGLIIVALIANLFWKEGITTAIVPFIVSLLLTLVIIRYGLMEFSNFRISQLGSLYANIDEVFRASPKIYIVLLTTTMLASRASLKYGWDYGGILTAGLLALQWYSPARIVMTFVEAIFIFLVSSWLLNSSFLESKNVINARKILLFFNIGFIYRIILGDTVMLLMPEERVIEFYGFGYLLTTLMALKMHESNNATTTGFMIGFTALCGFVIGSVIAFVLAVASGYYNSARLQPIIHAGIEAKEIQIIDGYLAGLVETYKKQTLATGRIELDIPALEQIYDLDVNVVTPLVNLSRSNNRHPELLKERLSKINSFADLYGYEIILFKDLAAGQELMLLAPKKSAPQVQNWGLYIFNLNAASDQLIQVPRPFDEASTLEFALYLFQKVKAQYLLIGGTYSDANRDRSSDLTRPQAKQSLYNLVSQALLREHEFTKTVMQIRGYSLSIDSTAKADTDILLAFSDGAIKTQQLNPPQKEIVNIIEQEKLTYNIVSGDEKTSGYEVGQMFLSRYLLQTPNTELAVMWLSPFLRGSYRSPDNNFLAQSLYRALNIQTTRTSLSALLQGTVSQGKIKFGWVPEKKLRDLIELYISSDDIIILKTIIDQPDYQFTYVILNEDGRDYLAIQDAENNLLGLVSLSNKAESEGIFTISPDEDFRPDLNLKRWIIFKGIEK